MMRKEEGLGNRARPVTVFSGHLPIYVIVNLGLVAIWFYSGQGFFWPGFPIVFWGLGVFSHYVAAYRRPGGGWIDRETDRILKEEEGKS